MNEIKTITVDGMSCGGCAKRIKNSLEELNGIVSIEVYLDNKKVTVEYDSEKVSLNTINEKIEDLGFDVTI